MKTMILIFYLTLLQSPGFAHFQPPDSTHEVEALKAANLRLTTRIHSKGLFSYGGRLVSDNSVMDFNFTYDRKTWGFQLFKALDFQDPNTSINFTLAVINKPMHFGKKLTLTPSAGFILEQMRSFADHGSDVVVIVVAGYKISREITFEYSTLLGNLLLEPKMRDWVNRLRLLYTKNHLDLAFMGWHNNSIFDSTDYTTAGVSVFYSRVPLGKHAKFNAGVTGLIMPYSSNETEIPKKNGVFITFSLVLD